MTKFCGSCNIGMPESVHSDKVFCTISKQWYKEYHECNLVCPKCGSDKIEQSYNSFGYIECNNCGEEF
jgi:hypothetical protein